MSKINLIEGNPFINGREHILSKLGYIAGVTLLLTGCNLVEPVRTTGGSANEGNNPPPSDTTNETGFVVNTSGGINELGNTPPPNGFTGGSANEGNNPPL